MFSEYPGNALSGEMAADRAALPPEIIGGILY